MKKMNNCITLKNLDKCKNTLLYLLSLQIPGNREKIIKCEPKITYCKSSAGTIIKQVENPNINFVKPCNLCPHMKKITLQNILKSLKEDNNFIEIDNEIILKARGAIEKMITVGR